MHTFQINVLIQFLVSSTRFESHVFIIRKIICTCNILWYVFLHLGKQTSRRKDVLNTVSSTCMCCRFKWSSWRWTHCSKHV